MNYISSIANQQPGKFLVSKYPVEDFNDGSILTVNPGEVAVFANNGAVAGIFPNGRYELTTQNYPFINAFRRFLANGQLTYHCSVFFVSETQSAEVLWGFQLPVRDPVQNIYTKIFVRGSYTARVNDGGKLIVQLLGMNVNFMAAPDIKTFFGNRFQQQISNVLAQYISQSGREVLDLCTDNLIVSEQITPKLAEIVASSGLEVMNFCISSMQIDENDPNRRILEQAYAKCREREIMGDQYSFIKDTDIRTNASLTSFAGMGFGNVQGRSSAPPSSESSMSNQTSFGGTSTSESSMASFEKLKQLHEMQQAGLISQEEYDNVKSEILRRLI